MATDWLKNPSGKHAMFEASSQHDEQIIMLLSSFMRIRVRLKEIRGMLQVQGKGRGDD